MSQTFLWRFDNLHTHRKTALNVRVIVCTQCGEVRTLAEKPDQLSHTDDWNDFVVPE